MTFTLSALDTVIVPLVVLIDQLSEKASISSNRARTIDANPNRSSSVSRRITPVIIAALLLSAPAYAQHGGESPARMTSPPREATQFNFLIGQWDLEVRPAPTGLAQKIHGVPKLLGTWKAWRALDGFGIEDELRITDRSGNPMALSHAVRIYDANAKSWKTSSLDVYRGVFTSAIAQMRGMDMMASSRGTDAEGKPYVSRGRYSEITPRSFRFVQERSTDNGKTWSTNLTIEATRSSSSTPN